MSFQKPKLKPFEKDFPAKDNWPKGVNNKSYQYSTEMVQVFNSNTSDRSPTTSASEYKSISKNKFLKMPFSKD